MKTNDIVSLIVAILGGAFGLVSLLISNSFKKQAEKHSEDKATKKEFSDLKTEVAIMQKQMEVFWKNVSFGAASILHSPHPENARTDYLLDQFRGNKITLKEERELIEILENILHSEEKTPQANAANSLLAYLKAKNYVYENK